MAENTSLNQYKNNYCQNFVNIYSGDEGFLKFEDGTELRCKFEAGQLENGEIILTCDFSVFDFQKCFPMFRDLEKSSVSEIKIHITICFLSIRTFLEKFNSFNGKTSDKLMNITGKINFLSKIDNNSIDDHNSERIKIVYSMIELSANTSTNENIQYMKFGVTNFRFGDESDEVLPLNINGVKRLTIKKNKNYENAWSSLEISNGIRVTCSVIVEIDNKTIDNKTKIKNSEEIINDLCDIMSIALGTRIQWIYLYAYNSEEKTVLLKHEYRVTKPYFINELINFNNIKIAKKFMESSYIALADKSNILRANEESAKPLINAYLDAKTENDFLEGRGIKLVVVMEMFKEASLKLKVASKNIIKEEYFENLKPIIEEALKNAIEKSINYKYGKKSEQDKVQIKKEIEEKILNKISDLNDTKPVLIEKKYLKYAKSAIEKPLKDAIEQSVNQEWREKNEQDIEKHKEKMEIEVLENISGLNRTSFKEILLKFCEYINLHVTDDYIQSVVDSRNRLIHEGKFLCQSDTKRIKKRYRTVENYPQYKDPINEYFFLMNFVDKCFLKLLKYEGPYFNWSINDKDELQ